MVKSALVTLIIGLCSNALAQGTMLFTWHGQNNYFQASFQVTEAETLPGSIFSSSLWTNSIQITSLDGLTYRASNQLPAPYIAGRFGPPLSFTYILADQNTESSITAIVVPFQGAAISESSPLPNGHNLEQGFWSYEAIPEPSTTALTILGAGILLMKKRRVSDLLTLR
jgi:hypothetical protein